MKRKITQRYMIVFTVSVALIIALWVGLSYVAIFTEKEADKMSPHIMASVFECYLNEQTLEINEEGKKLLRENNMWVQIIDRKGKVLQEFDAPDIALTSYDVFQISNYVLNSNAMQGQSIFLSSFNYHKNYGAIIGCRSSVISKYNIQFSGGQVKQILKSSGIMICLFVIMGLVAGLIFSRTISSPVQDIIADINSLEADILLESRNYKKNLFSSVYDSLNKLQLRLKSADRERAIAERQKNEWIKNISHDMRTPLSSIKGYAELIAEESYNFTSEERKQFSEIIINNSENIDNLIQELKFNRLSEEGTLVLNKEEINLNKLIKECCDELPADYSNERITYKFESRILYADVDRQMFKRCFTNLIGNAFIHNNGDVKVSIESYREEDNIVIKISDDGKGMNSGDMDRIFERYYRGVEAKRDSGSGLGLAIVKEIVEAHGGEISVQSKEGKGTTFVMRI